jgi:xanthine dehydrogenase accessory factor
VTPEEIAVSILAEVIQVRRSAPPRAGAPTGAGAAAMAAEARDPVCGMAVEVATARHRSEVGGRPVYFCCAGCQARFDADPARYAAV